MSLPCCFELLELHNRLGQTIALRACPFHFSEDEVCVLVAVPEGMHQASFSKSAEHIAFQLYERFNEAACGFSLVELRDVAGKQCWYRWRFTWVGSTPIEGRQSQLSKQERQRYLQIIEGPDAFVRLGQC